jgi:hypothetical protein
MGILNLLQNKKPMNKSSHFSGQPTFIQLVRLMPKHLISHCVINNEADYCCKKFDTWTHLLTMIFTCCAHCDSLREVITGLAAMAGKLNNADLGCLPKRSTLSDANAKRESKVFEDIFFELKAYFKTVLPDSRAGNDSVYIIDSSTIKLFQEIFKGAGLSKQNGKRKGGLKVHMAVLESDPTPSIIHLSPSANNDGIFLKFLDFAEGSTVIMDMGYRNFKQFNQWNQDGVTWVTRLHPHTSYVAKKRNAITKKEKKAGVKSDAIIRMGSDLSKAEKVKCRLIQFKSPETGKSFSFISNDLISSASTIAATYKKRWSIELLFKRLKQNMPLKYFLGDNPNAIKIQVWCALITDLLFQVIRCQVKRKWAFSNIVKLVRLHLFNYMNLFSFLENPERSVIRTTRQDFQLALDLSG